MKKKITSILMEVAKIALAVGLLYYLFHSGRIDPEQLRRLATPGMTLLGLVVVGLTLYLASERWRVLLRQQALPTSSWLAFRLTLIGNFFNFFVPGGVGGDLVKAVLIAREKPEQKGKIALTVLADRILGLFTMVLLSLLSFAFALDMLANDWIVQLIFAGLLVLTLGFFAGFWLLFASAAQRLRQFATDRLAPWPRLHHIWIVAQSYRFTLREWAEILGLSLAAQVLQVLLFIIVATSLGPLPPLNIFFFAVPVGFMVTAVPIAPNGIGIGQAAFLYLFTRALGHESDIGTLGITAYQAYQLAYGVLGALCFVLLRRKHPGGMSLQDLENEGSVISGT